MGLARAAVAQRNDILAAQDSLLDERQVAAVIKLLRISGALFCASMIDLADYSPEDIAKHRERRSAGLAVNLTDGHTQELRDSVAELQARMAGFSDQLYVQGAVTIDLLYNVMQDMIVYHCQRFPKELGEFHWVIDAKNPGAVTNWEDWWSKTLVIWLQAMSLVRPGAMLSGGDYCHFRRFIFDELPEYLRDVPPCADRSPGAGIDLQKMYGESFRFSSESEPGLELVDIVTNALRRGLIGNLGEAGCCRWSIPSATGAMRGGRLVIRVSPASPPSCSNIGTTTMHAKTRSSSASSKPSKR